MPEPLLVVRHLSKSFGSVKALENLSLSLGSGASLGLVGGSGSGKSTLARSIARFESPDRGEILIDGRAGYTPADVQLIMQEAAASLNPRFTAGEAVAEPLIIQRRGDRAQRWDRVRECLKAVGLPPEAASKPALAFSGGERQRLAIARALAPEPRLLILDESLSGLDVLLQAQIVDLLRRLRGEFGLTLLLISHDLALAARIADEIAVMHEGTIVERAPAEELMRAPAHPRAAELVSAAQWLSLKGALA